MLNLGEAYARFHDQHGIADLIAAPLGDIRRAYNAVDAKDQRGAGAALARARKDLARMSSAHRLLYGLDSPPGAPSTFEVWLGRDNRTYWAQTDGKDVGGRFTGEIGPGWQDTLLYHEGSAGHVYSMKYSVDKASRRVRVRVAAAPSYSPLSSGALIGSFEEIYSPDQVNTPDDAYVAYRLYDRRGKLAAVSKPVAFVGWRSIELAAPDGRVVAEISRGGLLPTKAFVTIRDAKAADPYLLLCLAGFHISRPAMEPNLVWPSAPSVNGQGAPGGLGTGPDKQQ